MLNLPVCVPGVLLSDDDELDAAFLAGAEDGNDETCLRPAFKMLYPELRAAPQHALVAVPAPAPLPAPPAASRPERPALSRLAPATAPKPAQPAPARVPAAKHAALAQNGAQTQGSGIFSGYVVFLSKEKLAPGRRTSLQNVLPLHGAVVAAAVSAGVTHIVAESSPNARMGDAWRQASPDALWLSPDWFSTCIRRGQVLRTDGFVVAFSQPAAPEQPPEQPVEASFGGGAGGVVMKSYPSHSGEWALGVQLKAPVSEVTDHTMPRSKRARRSSTDDDDSQPASTRTDADDAAALQPRRWSGHARVKACQPKPNAMKQPDSNVALRDAFYSMAKVTAVLPVSKFKPGVYEKAWQSLYGMPLTATSDA